MAKKEFSFNDAVVEIENILHNIESGDLDIDKLSVEVKRASELIKIETFYVSQSFNKQNLG